LDKLSNIWGASPRVLGDEKGSREIDRDGEGQVSRVET